MQLLCTPNPASLPALCDASDLTENRAEGKGSQDGGLLPVLVTDIKPSRKSLLFCCLADTERPYQNVGRVPGSNPGALGDLCI